MGCGCGGSVNNEAVRAARLERAARIQAAREAKAVERAAKREARIARMTKA